MMNERPPLPPFDARTHPSGCAADYRLVKDVAALGRLLVWEGSHRLGGYKSLSRLGL